MFKFRLQKVLDYRQIQTNEAKMKLLAATAERLRGERAVGQILEHRSVLLSEPAATLSDRLALEARLLKSEDEERFAKTATAVLRGEEENAQRFWREKKRELETVEKLRDKALEEWKLSEARKEQAALDEWSTLRRAS